MTCIPADSVLLDKVSRGYNRIDKLCDEERTPEKECLNQRVDAAPACYDITGQKLVIDVADEACKSDMDIGRKP